MLILSRRPKESIVLPEINVSVEVVEVQGKRVRLGIVAPPHLKVLRQEIEIPVDIKDFHSRSDVSHALRNRLSAMQLAVQLAQKHLLAGRKEACEATLVRLQERLRSFQMEEQDNELADKSRFSIEPKNSRRVLVVEDDRDERELLAECLRAEGWMVSTAVDGFDAMSHLENEPVPEFLLLDLRMPRCDGSELLRHIRAQPTFEKLKVFVVSGMSQSNCDIDIDQQQIEGWFCKPLDASQVAFRLGHNICV
ncbi:response regulator [bacterium]|nr:response regulator [bacterium]